MLSDEEAARVYGVWPFCLGVIISNIDCHGAARTQPNSAGWRSETYDHALSPSEYASSVIIIRKLLRFSRRKP